MSAPTYEQLVAQVAALQQSNSRLHRRCQQAEAAAINSLKDGGHRRSGRAVLNFLYVLARRRVLELERENEELRARALTPPAGAQEC